MIDYYEIFKLDRFSQLERIQKKLEDFKGIYKNSKTSNFKDKMLLKKNKLFVNDAIEIFKDTNSRIKYNKKLENYQKNAAPIDTHIEQLKESLHYKDLIESKDYFKNTLKYTSNKSDYCYEYAKILYENLFIEESIIYFELSIEYNPSKMKSYEFLIKHYLSVDNSKLAKEYAYFASKYLKDNFSNLILYYNVKFLYNKKKYNYIVKLVENCIDLGYKPNDNVLEILRSVYLKQTLEIGDINNYRKYKRTYNYWKEKSKILYLNEKMSIINKKLKSLKEIRIKKFSGDFKIFISPMILLLISTFIYLNDYNFSTPFINQLFFKKAIIFSSIYTIIVLYFSYIPKYALKNKFNAYKIFKFININLVLTIIKVVGVLFFLMLSLILFVIGIFATIGEESSK